MSDAWERYAFGRLLTLGAARPTKTGLLRLMVNTAGEAFSQAFAEN